MGARFSSSLKQQILLSYTQLGSYAAVARAHGVSASGVRRLVLAAKSETAPAAPASCSAAQTPAKAKPKAAPAAPASCSAAPTPAKAKPKAAPAAPTACNSTSAQDNAVLSTTCNTASAQEHAVPSNADAESARSASPSVCLTPFSGQLGGGPSSPTAEPRSLCVAELEHLKSAYAAILLHACIIEVLAPERLQKARVSEITGLMRTVLEKFAAQDSSDADALRKLDMLIEGLNHAAKQ